MAQSTAHFRESGSGTYVICIHSSASSSSQWRALLSSLSKEYHAVAVDLYGYGKSPNWPSDNDVRLVDEIALIEPILSQAGRFHLVGHSHGATISLKIALDNPDKVASLTLYEPTAFYLLDPGEPARLEIETIRDETKRLCEACKKDKAAEIFVDYWIGPGAWRATAESARVKIANGMGKVRFEWGSGFDRECSFQQIQALSMPILLLTGSQTKSSTRSVVAVLRKLLPRAYFAELNGLGHMGPITHPDVVNREIVDFINSVQQ
jgi:pimeloyl-ACP methyl ester carboxylesterase